MLADEASKAPKLALAGIGEFALRPIAHGDIAEYTKIPKPYYDRMLAEAPELLANNVNRWFGKYGDGGASRMVRTLDGFVRCLLSEAYRPLDNFDLAKAILPVLAERKLEIVSCEVTERRLYLKAIDTTEVKVPVGYKMGDGSHQIFDCCAPALVASNSEVGYGRLTLETGIYTKGCTNLSWWAEGGMKRTHVGARHKLTDAMQVENIDHLLSDKTKKITDAAIWSQVGDLVKAAFDPALLAKRCDKLTAAAQNKIGGKVAKVIEVTAERFGLNAGEQESVLQHLIEGGSLTQYGLQAAITRTAQDAADYDRATELEYLGGRVIELGQQEWAELASAV